MHIYTPIWQCSNLITYETDGGGVVLTGLVSSIGISAACALASSVQIISRLSAHGMDGKSELAACTV
jgi:hypothetical protein